MDILTESDLRSGKVKRKDNKVCVKAGTFITPYNEPMCVMLNKLHGVTTEVRDIPLDFDRRISASVHSHTH